MTLAALSSVGPHELARSRLGTTAPTKYRHHHTAHHRILRPELTTRREDSISSGTMPRRQLQHHSSTPRISPYTHPRICPLLTPASSQRPASHGGLNRSSYYTLHRIRECLQASMPPHVFFSHRRNVSYRPRAARFCRFCLTPVPDPLTSARLASLPAGTFSVILRNIPRKRCLATHPLAAHPLILPPTELHPPLLLTQDMVMHAQSDGV
ncbi:hypothetical protein CC85DRAFT_123022 [Cutaneotrichosporon oleaginosum]|uniref:Uncharacterized protein n=1 Tax=Cutaneotrichosporon oleaginosum TaxID=879819 RepID=A0A0J0XJW2_9TREE|nr:uncharacterized protein CC85DRAFT_123022 [Cutaneotrichosporon oleaginosum]KLT41346.1 hypothetical protein CC85DRAFT_123022 [Cutaneotrichosporon oleaginosum]TXT06290.1 hypothetical protein COLE_05621 [Cutaneotrichosporon oleaginosum]